MKSVLLAIEFYMSSVQRIRKGVIDFAQQNGWHLSVVGRRFQLPEYWHGEGILTHINQSPQLFDFLKKNSDTPVVSFAPPLKKLGFSFSTVREDDFLIGKTAAQHFIQNGCNHACWYGNDALGLRGRSFLRAMRHRGIRTTRITPTVKERGLPWDVKNNWLAQQIIKLSLPCCIFCENDTWAYELLEAALLVGLKVPEDIAILGVDNDSVICESLKVPLSSIDNQLEKIGYEGSALLNAMMEGQKDMKKLLLIPPVPDVVTRKSTDILAIKHPVLKEAVELVKKNFYDPDISVKRLAKSAFISESGLRKLFKSQLNISPLHLIHKLRIQKACVLLRDTDLKIDSVARQVGFHDIRRFYDVFYKQMDVPPAEFRKEQS